MKQVFKIPFRLPSLNEVNDANRRNRYAGAKMKNGTDAAIVQIIKTAKLIPVRRPCIVHMLFMEPNRRRDVDNVESARKFILDALVKSGILLGDAPKYVVGAPAYTLYTQGDPYVAVTIVAHDSVDYLRQLLRRSSEVITE